MVSISASLGALCTRYWSGKRQQEQRDGPGTTVVLLRSAIMTASVECVVRVDLLTCYRYCLIAILIRWLVLEWTASLEVV